MAMRKDKAPQQLAKFLAYMLGRRPDEFGLMPDDHGYVKVKTVLQALSEEQGWRYVREAHLNEMLIVVPRPSIERRGKHLRASDRQHLPALQVALDMPKLLFACVRRRAYTHICRKGLRATADSPVILAADPDLATRMGRRIDAQPVLLSVNVAQASASGVLFRRYGTCLFTAPFIPTDCFTGPPLPKERKSERPSRITEPLPTPPTPGSYVVDPTIKSHGPTPKQRRRPRKGPGWKEDRKRLRKQKKKFDKQF
jgi:putative RNA 2'-phosphotransferase